MDFSKYSYYRLNDYGIRHKRKIFSLIKKFIVFCIIIFVLYLPILYILYSKTIETDKLDLENFEFLITNDKKGPITVNREKDDGSKLNIYSMIIKNVNNTLYDDDEFSNLDEIIEIDPQYLCEYRNRKPSESFKGYYISCPTHYTISINNTFYGRYKNDFEHCTKHPNGRRARMSELRVKKTCGVEPLDTLKELCEDRKECLVKPCNAFFENACSNTLKYLYIDYYCKKDIVCI